MHPQLLTIGDFTLHSYGLAFAGSVLLGILLSSRRATHEGVDELVYLRAMVIGIVGILVGSKLLHIIVSWQWYLDRPARLLQFRVGHVFYGGYLGAVVFPWVYARFIARQPFLPMLDLAATYMPLGLAIHRAFGCFNAGCCYGGPTDLPWGVVFPPGSPANEVFGSVAVHPAQLYEALFALGLFYLLLFWRKHYRRVPGEQFTLQVAVYAVGRFLLEVVRGDPERGQWGPLSTSQWISVGMLLAAGLLTAYIVRQRRLLAGKPAAAR